MAHRLLGFVFVIALAAALALPRFIESRRPPEALVEEAKALYQHARVARWDHAELLRARALLERARDRIDDDDERLEEVSRLLVLCRKALSESE